MTTCACGKTAEAGSDECFRCRVASVGFTLRGGAFVGSGNFHKTKGEFLREHMRVDSEKELAKRPGIERFDDNAPYREWS